uniref:Peptidase_M13 domain-containing protein n=1 Tax=Steinernema glaseri TaxID=37863 RepID=A0A1I7Z001_9BILA
MCPLMLLPVALLFLSASISGAAERETFFFSQVFSSTVKPCHDLNEFVCNPKENPSENLFETQRAESMKSLISDFFLNSTDPIVLHLRKIAERVVLERDEFALGKKLGQEAAYGETDVPGIFYPTIDGKLTTKSLLLKFDEYGDDDEHGSCFYPECPTLFQGILYGFYHALSDHPTPFNKSTVYFQRYNSTDASYHASANPEGVDRELLKQIHASKASYFYMLWAKEAIEEGTFPLEIIASLRDIFENVRSEVILMLTECAWMTEEQKKEAVDYMRGGFGTVLGFPDVFFNSTRLDEAIGFIKGKFPLLLERDYDSRKSCDDTTCQYTRLSEALHLADRIHREENPDFDDGLDEGNSKSSLLGYNAFNKFTQTVITPAYIHIFKDPYPLGFLYGSIGGTFGHELFHSLGLLRKPFREHFSFHDTPEIRNATICYADYFSSFTLEGAHRTLRPDGAVKSEEGFADVEGARIAFRALERLLNQNPKKKRSAAQQVPFDDFKWFFIGLASKFCSAESGVDEEARQLLTYSHPRSAIRANAVVKQMKAFTDTFHCLPDDQMYVTKDVCALYPSARGY